MTVRLSDSYTVSFAVADIAGSAAVIWNDLVVRPGEPDLIVLGRVGQTVNFPITTRSFSVPGSRLRAGAIAATVLADYTAVTGGMPPPAGLATGMVINSDIINWSGLRRFFAPSSSDPNLGNYQMARYMAVSAIMHEFGHAMGLLHPYAPAGQEAPTARQVDSNAQLFRGVYQVFAQSEVDHATLMQPFLNDVFRAEVLLLNRPIDPSTSTPAPSLPERAMLRFALEYTCNDTDGLNIQRSVPPVCNDNYIATGNTITNSLLPQLVHAAQYYH